MLVVDGCFIAFVYERNAICIYILLLMLSSDDDVDDDYDPLCADA